MLERVMRRFGLARRSPAREPTYLEALLDKVSARLPHLLEQKPEANPLAVIAYAVIDEEGASDLLPAEQREKGVLNEGLRTYLDVLLENDQLPPSGQLSEAELAVTRKLLLQHDADGDVVSENTDRVLSLLEQKFNAGQFPQASTLLQLFHTTPARQRNNERTLFYEDMISRFAVLRATRVASSLVRRYQRALAGDEDVATRLTAAAEWLSQEARVNLDVLGRAPEDLRAWEEHLSGVKKPAEREDVLAQLPPIRWRRIHEFGPENLVALIKSHLENGAVTDYLGRLLRICYFIVLVTGKTGFEHFIKRYFEWVEHNFDYPGTRLLPELHRRTTIEEVGLEEAIDNLRQSLMAEGSKAILDGLDDARIAADLDRLAAHLERVDPNEIPPGDYNVTGLLLDQSTRLTCDDPILLFRIHRIC